MAGDGDGSRNGTGIGIARTSGADAVPASWSTCARPTIHASTARPLALLERPLLAHVLALTGGNQLRAGPPSSA